MSTPTTTKADPEIGTLVNTLIDRSSLLVTESENLMAHLAPILPIEKDRPIAAEEVAESKDTPLGRQLFEVLCHIQAATGNIRKMNEEMQI